MSDPNVDMDQIMLDLLTHQGFLSKETLPNGKVWYKRTDKKLPNTTNSNKGSSQK